MGSIIIAHCHFCGKVRLSTDDITLVIYRNYLDRSHYLFRCTGCAARVRQLVDEETIAVLASVCVRTVMTEVPAEALERKTGPPLCIDDLLDFKLLLAALRTPASLCHASDDARTWASTWNRPADGA